MSNITIKTRQFKLQNGEIYTLEYPSNYDELVDRKLQILQKEYDEVHEAEEKAPSQDIKKDADDNKIDKINNNIENKDEDLKENINEKIENDGENNINNNSIDENNNDYYQPLGEAPDNLDDDEFVEVKEYTNTENNTNIDNNLFEKNNVINKNEEEEDIKLEDFDFVDSEIKKEVKVIKRKTSPVKNPEKIKNAMKSIKLKPPEWAKNLSDKDFLFRAKNFLKAKSKLDK